MGLQVPQSPVSAIVQSADPYPDHVTVYGLPYADLAATAAGPVRFPWVRWSHGLLVEEATTNLVLNPAPATTTNYTGASGTLALDSDFGLTRAKSLSFIATAIPAAISFAYATTVAATIYTFSAYVYTAVRPVTVRPEFDWKNSAGSAISTTTGTAVTIFPGVWQRITYTVTSPALAVRAHPKVNVISPSVIGDKVWTANWQVEQKGHATSYAEGGVATGYTWSGTTDNSSSLRAASSSAYTLPVSATSNNGLTICAWVDPPFGLSRVGEFARVAAGGVYLAIDYTNSGSDLRARTATGTVTLATDATLTGPAFIAATCESTTLTGLLYQLPLDADSDVGVVSDTSAITAISAAMTTVNIGSGGGGGTEGNSPVEQVQVFNSSLDVGTLEFMARSLQPANFTDDSRCVFAAGSVTDIVGTSAHALATSGTYQALGMFPGRLELTANLMPILTAAQEVYAYRLALPLGTGGFGVGSRVEIGGDGTLHAVGLIAASGSEVYLFLD